MGTLVVIQSSPAEHTPISLPPFTHQRDDASLSTETNEPCDCPWQACQVSEFENGIVRLPPRTLPPLAPCFVQWCQHAPQIPCRPVVRPRSSRAKARHCACPRVNIVRWSPAFCCSFPSTPRGCAPIVPFMGVDMQFTTPFNAPGSQHRPIPLPIYQLPQESCFPQLPARARDGILEICTKPRTIRPSRDHGG